MMQVPKGSRVQFSWLMIVGLAVFWPAESWQAQVLPGQRMESDIGNDRRQVEIPLSEVGIADWRFVSPRDPETILPKELCELDLAFSNETLDRSFVVEMEVPKAIVGSQLVLGDEPKLSPESPDPVGDFFLPPCDPKKVKKCKVIAVVSPAATVRLPAQVFDPERKCDGIPRGSYNPAGLSSGVEEALYVISVKFFDDVESPSMPNGYVFVPKGNGVPSGGFKPVELESKLGVKLTAAVGYKQDTDPNRFAEADSDRGIKAGDVKPFSAAEPFQGDTRSSFTGVGRLDLTTNLGSRADALVTFSFKNGDLGEKDSTGTVTTTQYRATAYGLGHVNLEFGKQTFEAPNSALAMSIKGEGFQLFSKGSSIGYLATRESEKGLANRQDRDNRLIFLVVDFFGLPWESKIAPKRQLSRAKLYALIGEEEGDSDLLKGPFDHWTIGLDVGGTVPNDHLRGCSSRVTVNQACYGVGSNWSFALYRSALDPDSGAAISKGRGTIGIVSVSNARIKVEKNKRTGSILTKSPRSLQITLGYGTGDDPTTPDENEGFIGQTAAFAPDKIFLSSLRKNLTTAVDVEGMEEPVRMGELGPSLSNKRYAGVVYTENTWSLLRYPARLFKVRDDISTEKSILSYHRYEFNEEVFGHHSAGQEISIEFQIEAPKGVTTNLGAAWFEAGRALEQLLEDDVWSFFANVTVAIGP